MSTALNCIEMSRCARGLKSLAFTTFVELTAVLKVSCMFSHGPVTEQYVQLEHAPFADPSANPCLTFSLSCLISICTPPARFAVVRLACPRAGMSIGFFLFASHPSRPRPLSPLHVLRLHVHLRRCPMATHLPRRFLSTLRWARSHSTMASTTTRPMCDFHLSARFRWVPSVHYSCSSPLIRLSIEHELLNKLYLSKSVHKRRPLIVLLAALHFIILLKSK